MGTNLAGEHSSARHTLAGWGLLAAVLAIVLIRYLGDLDFGFYVASGREILANGIPAREFLAPILSSETLSSQWMLSALLFAGAWSLGGPAGITMLCALGYAGGVALAVLAAAKRGMPIFAAVVAGALVTCIVGVRFVERPGCFSVLLLGMVMLVLQGTGPLDWRRRVALLAMFALWPWMHAEWLVGLGATALLLFDREGMNTRMASTVAGCALIPTLLFAGIHPSGAAVLLAPIRFLFGGGADFQVKEYGFAAYSIYPPLLAAFLLGPLASWQAWRKGRRGEALALLGLTLLALRIPRALLPMMILAIPALAEVSQRLVAGARWRQVTIAIGLLAFSVYTGTNRPGRVFGFGLDDRLDARGIADVLGRIPRREGFILSEFGMSSMLLVHPSVVRQGVIMDGRQEAYPKAYFDDVYTTALQPSPLAETGEDPRVWYARNGIAFYFETWEGIWPGFDPSGLYAHFSALGWQTIAWDNTGILMAAPHIVGRYELPTFDPPANLQLTNEELNDPKLLAELFKRRSARMEDLVAHGYPAPRPLLAVARMQAAMGKWGDARASLERARAQGAERYASFKTIEALIQAFGEP